MDLEKTQGTDILGLSRDDLTAWFAEKNEPAWRADQVMRWLHRRNARSFSEMTDIAKGLRETLAESFVIPEPEEAGKAVSEDGTVKYAFSLRDGRRIESVLIPERGHCTLCVSSQVGCAMGCAFCRTGSLGLTRNLAASEIIGQVRAVRRMMEKPETLTNLVFMGMGEPLANYANLVRAVNILTGNEWGMGFGSRHVTVSTVGLANRIPDLSRDTPANLAVSVNAADDETRQRIMPVNRTYPLAALLAACHDFFLRPGRRITFEYVLLKDLNDSERDARNLARLLSHIPAKINLIAYNPHPESPFARPDEDRVLAFQKVLTDRNFTAMLRKSKGADILAACGQLAARMSA
ncbi:MAG: 23S rRNA (adenine(2503)-C(2))-methyltransferase RlmN [Thermodesulfobacteriota bacterium]